MCRTSSGTGSWDANRRSHMRTSRRMFVSAVGVAALTFLTAVPAYAGPGKDKEPARVAAVADDSQAPDRAVTTKAAPAAATSALAVIQSRIAAYVAKNGTAYTFA